jgi:hypothetical protein
MEDVILAAIKRRFTQRAEEVEQAFNGSAAFRGLCRDYLSCFAGLERWRESQSGDAPARLAEYSQLLAELTMEIDARLRAGTK